MTGCSIVGSVDAEAPDWKGFIGSSVTDSNNFLSPNSVLGISLKKSYPSSHSVLPASLMRQNYCFHFIGEETEAFLRGFLNLLR